MNTVVLTALLLLSTSTGLQAQALIDPTRPSNAVAAEHLDTVPSQQLQSILIAAGRRVAVVNGEVVRVGGQLGDATVVKIEPTAITLRRGGETEILRMYSGIEMKAVRGRPARAARADAGSEGEKGNRK
jgi:MSHA biogenesis protein MshK